MIRIFKSSEFQTAYSGKAIILSNREFCSENYQNIMLYSGGFRHYCIAHFNRKKFIDAERPDGTLST